MANQVSNVDIKLQSGTTRTLYTEWDWSKADTKQYLVKWSFATGDGVWFTGQTNTVTRKLDTYTAPDNATKVKVSIKPEAKTKKTNGKDVPKWTAEWSTITDKAKYNFKEFIVPAAITGTIDVGISGSSLTASVDVYDPNTDMVQFSIVANDKTVVDTLVVPISKNRSSCTINVALGMTYKVKARGVRQREENTYGEWSQYSSSIGTIPSTPISILKCYSLSETSIQVEWSVVGNVTGYTIQYTTDKTLFDMSSSVSSVTIDNISGKTIITGLETGDIYYFRVQATNQNGVSGWSTIECCALGTPPAPPTTWQDLSVCVVGTNVDVYWIHNSLDGSLERYAEIQISVGSTTKYITIEKNPEIQNNAYSITTTNYKDGDQIKWRVRTKGVLEIYSQWSVERTITVRQSPTLTMRVRSNWQEVSQFGTVKGFPISIIGTVLPDTQKLMTYNIDIQPTETHESYNEYGNKIIISKGTSIYNKTMQANNTNQFTVNITPKEVTLINNISYVLKCTIATNVGLSDEKQRSFTTLFTSTDFDINAQILFDSDNITTTITPTCIYDTGNNVDMIYLSVYRRETDGTFTTIAEDIDNAYPTTVRDMHPALDYARYRILATVKNTGEIFYYDVPDIYIGNKSIVISWDEQYSRYLANTALEYEFDNPILSTSILILPYNITTSKNNDRDISLVKYIGRRSPVSYYGTQLGESASWSVDIDAEDETTLNTIKRLAIWNGDVYVREPYGDGYWASIKVSYSTKYNELTIPITFDITRVEGGM